VSLVLRARLLEQAGFRHGFSLRTGGVSEQPFASLNLARNLGDDPAAVAENHRRLAHEVGYAVEALYEVSQVHGKVVHAIDPAMSPVEFRRREGDALWAKERDRAVGVRVADCVPILLASSESGAVAAIHAGWRGVEANVIGESVRALCGAVGLDPSTLIAAIGPHIGVEAFEVSDEVAQQIAVAVADPEVVVTGEPRPHVDLARAVQGQLERSGLLAAQIERVQGCTYAEPARFFSFRREGQASGRHLAVIVAGC